jgi:hypothetical protein
MQVKKVIAALAMGSLICVAVLGLRTQATAQHDEKKGEAGGRHQGVGPTDSNQGE